ncbi:p38 MAP kinase [Penicillium sp. IBT 18751x]|nr:p38 MAP kinase [Penicillium sp. IBT 18751x]
MAYFVPHNVSNELVEVTASSARDQILQQNVMLKKFAEPFATASIAKHRQLSRCIYVAFGRHVCCPTPVITSPCSDELNSYLISELMETDLRTLLRTKGIDQEFVQYFLYQIMRGLKYAHSAGVFHHDLKPSQILVNRNCDLKICNFGIAHVQNSSTTAYDSVLHYKAPELLFSTQNYHGQTDIWSAGCIFAEMLVGKPLFPGDNSIHQLHAITKLLGSPPDHMLINEITKNVGTKVLQSGDGHLSSENTKTISDGLLITRSHDRIQISFYHFQKAKANHCLPFCQAVIH